MTQRADPGFLVELQKYGTVNVEACFNCGNCSAVCPLADDEAGFPRRMIRYGQLGLREPLLSSKELWLCYYCGECTETCPRQADPAGFMAAARSYAIGQYDRLGLARRLYTSAMFTVVFLLGLAAALALIIYAFHGPMPGATLDLFAFIPEEAVHNAGIIVGVLMLLALLAGVANMVVHLRRQAGLPQGVRPDWPRALRETVVEVIGQRRYREGCEDDDEPREPWYGRRWLVHTAILWGFLGLFLATILDYGLALLSVKATGTWVPIWYPVRLLGTVAGLVFIYGVTAAIVRRARHADASAAHSTPADWAFLALLWLAGVTGFVLEFAVYLPEPHAWSYWMLLGHVVVVLELLLLLPFSKFAHAVYRSLALYFYALKPRPAVVAAGALGTGSVD